MKVLIVEDHDDSAAMLSRWLSFDGHTVRVVHDGLAAVGVALEFLPDAVISDLGLPGIDGFELARRLRAEPGLMRARFVSVSGFGRREDRANSADSGFDVHLPKPVDLVALSHLLSDCSSAG